MHFGSILLLAVGLAMDAAAVSAARGLAARRVGLRHAALVAVYFGGAQGLMPLLGWGLGRGAGPALAAWDHWIAFVLLTGLGAKMLWEARGARDDAEETVAQERTLEGQVGDERAIGLLFGHRVMATLALATSVDAFAVGVTLPMLGAPVVLSCVTIGVTTAALSVAALFAGTRAGAALGTKFDLAGGLILVGLGVKVLVEHLRAGT